MPRVFLNSVEVLDFLDIQDLKFGSSINDPRSLLVGGKRLNNSEIIIITVKSLVYRKCSKIPLKF